MNIDTNNITPPPSPLTPTPTVQNAAGTDSLLFSPSGIGHVNNSPTLLANNDVVSQQTAVNTFTQQTPLQRLSHFLNPFPLQIAFKKEIDTALADYNAKSTKHIASVDYEKRNTIRVSLRPKSAIGSFIQREIPMYPYTGMDNRTKDNLLAHINRFLNAFSK